MSSRYRILLPLLVAAVLPLAGCGSLGNIFDWGGTDPSLEGERIPIMTTGADFTADPSLASEQIELPPATTNNDWPQAGSSVTNRIGHLQTTGSLQPIWQVNAGKGTDWQSILTATPIVADGKIFVLDAMGHVYVYDAATGAGIWNRSMAPPEEDDAERTYGGGLAFDNGRLYVTTGFRHAYAVNANTGETIWDVPVDTPIHTAPTVADGRVYVITQENQLLVLNSETGVLMWDHRGIAEPAALAASTNAAVMGDTVIVPYTSGELYALRTDNGTPYWGDQLTAAGNVTALTILNDIAGRPVIDGDMVFAVSHSGTLAGINMNTGGRAWTRNIPGIQTPLVIGDYVYMVSTQGYVMCLLREDGRIRWVTQLPAFGDPEDRDDAIVWSGPLVVNNRLLLFSSDGRAVSLLPATGQVANQISIPGGTFIAPIMANGILYVLTNEAQLVALR
jgi:outer membrane protein assembly factor BamB